MAHCDEGVRKFVEKEPLPQGSGTEEKEPDFVELLDKYEEVEAKLQELNEEKQRIRSILYAKMSLKQIEKASFLTSTGTKFVLQIQKVKRETVDKKLLRQELGEKAEKFITVTETEFLSIRPAKKNMEELKNKLQEEVRQ